MRLAKTHLVKQREGNGDRSMVQAERNRCPAVCMVYNDTTIGFNTDIRLTKVEECRHSCQYRAINQVSAVIKDMNINSDGPNLHGCQPVLIHLSNVTFSPATMQSASVSSALLSLMERSTILPISTENSDGRPDLSGTSETLQHANINLPRNLG